MRIALLGYGRMGREIEQAAAAHGHQVILTVDKDNPDDFNKERASECDVAMEFTGPDAAADTIIRAINMGLPVVSGSTGWLTRYEEIVSLCIEKKGSFIHSSNFSIGVNILFKLNVELARILSSLPEYSAVIEEIHHIYKVDAPSGTAISLAGGISGTHHGYDGWRKADAEIRSEEKNKVVILSQREGNVPGNHAVTWKSKNDMIIIRHEAFNRKGFAEGALLAASYIYSRKGVFTMSDVLNL